MSDETSITLDQFWRCPVCNTAFALGAPGAFTTPPRCGAHGEMEQVTAEGFAAGFVEGADDE